MPGLRNLLRKKERVQNDTSSQQGNSYTFGGTEIKFVRTTTELQETIQPPDFPDHNPRSRAPNFSKPHLGYRESSNAVLTRDPTARVSFDDQQSHEKSPAIPPQKEKRGLFHRSGRSRSKSDATTHIRTDLGEAPPLPSISVDGAVDQEEKTQREARWEKRATMLATNNTLLDSASQRSVSRDRSPSMSDAQDGDVSIQEAIRLHEEGDLATSTHMFGRLADPKGANNALSQVLYGLALRHGWGIEVDLQQGIHYLSLAAANSASIEEQALASGMKKGGAAKGELVLAIFELANCFRQGWGVNKDANAARQYYETAANLGDTDAMEEAAWCYLEGFGGSKDKFKAAQYLRMAEKLGGKTVGNSWIWKDKYNPK